MVFSSSAGSTSSPFSMPARIPGPVWLNHWSVSLYCLLIYCIRALMSFVLLWNMVTFSISLLISFSRASFVSPCWPPLPSFLSVDPFHRAKLRGSENQPIRMALDDLLGLPPLSLFHGVYDFSPFGFLPFLDCANHIQCLNTHKYQDRFFTATYRYY